MAQTQTQILLKMNNKLYIAALLLLITIASLVWGTLSHNKYQDLINQEPRIVVETETVTETDTIWCVRDSLIYIEKEVPVFVDSDSSFSFSRRFINKDFIADVSARVTVIEQGESISYRAKIGMQYAPSPSYSLRTTVKTNTLVKASRYYPKKIKDSSGLYIGAGGVIGPGYAGLGPSISIINKQGTSIGYTYDAVNQGHMLTVKRKVKFPKPWFLK